MQLNAVSTLYAVATAFGSMKSSKFSDFLEKMLPDEKDLNETLDQLKDKGLPIEDN